MGKYVYQKFGVSGIVLPPGSQKVTSRLLTMESLCHELNRLKAIGDKLAEALRRTPHYDCHQLDHAGGYYHKDSEQCPVEKMCKDALKDWEGPMSKESTATEEELRILKEVRAQGGEPYRKLKNKCKHERMGQLAVIREWGDPRNWD